MSNPQNPSEVAEHAAAIDAARLQRADKLVYVDTLRGIAILLVIWVHHGLNFTAQSVLHSLSTYGMLGVQLFFVASAYTLCRSADKRRAEPHPTSSFFIRRFFRIAPLYYIGILLYGMLAALQIEWSSVPRDPGDWTAGNVLANISFTHSFVPGAQNGIVPGGWSIGVEMVFYLCFPLLFVIYRKLFARHWMLAGFGLPILALGLDFMMVAGGYLMGNPIWPNNFLYFCFPNQLPAFLVGMSGYFLIASGKLRERPYRDVTGFVVFAGLSGLLLAGPWYGAALLPTAGAISFMFLLLLMRHYRHRQGLIERIGQNSFSMYLFHFLFVGSFTGAIVGALARTGVPIALVYPTTFMLVVGLTYLVSIVTKPLIEDTMIRFGGRIVRARDARSEALAAKVSVS